MKKNSKIFLKPTGPSAKRERPAKGRRLIGLSTDEAERKEGVKDDPSECPAVGAGALRRSFGARRTRNEDVGAPQRKTKREPLGDTLSAIRIEQSNNLIHTY